ncbi:hypothetical protein AWENTII_003184 [Aspergillus wentii]
MTGGLSLTPEQLCSRTLGVTPLRDIQPACGRFAVVRSTVRSNWQPSDVIDANESSESVGPSPSRNGMMCDGCDISRSTASSGMRSTPSYRSVPCGNGYGRARCNASLPFEVPK